MNITRLHMTKQLLNYARLINNVKNVQRMAPNSGFYSSLTIDAFTSEIFERHKSKFQRNDHTESSIQLSTYTSDTYDASTMSSTDLEKTFSELLTKNKHKKIEELVIQCQDCKKFLTYATLKKLFKHYSMYGRPEMVAVIQNYCLKVDPISYKRNGEFLHYLAKAECIRGNSEKGLAILKSSYKQYESLRSFYRIIFRELIQDSVLNRSEASLVIFRKYVMEFSERWSDHYPLVCFWHICWASTWFSDQMLGNELLEESEVLLDIVGEKATAFSIMALKDFNEDAVVRLLQTLLKYDMMIEYVAVLQVLFNFKCRIKCGCVFYQEFVDNCQDIHFYIELSDPDSGFVSVRNRDIRGCSEIIRNCEVLGVNLPSDQQGRYIKMLIDDKKQWPKAQPTKTTSKDFKLKF